MKLEPCVVGLQTVSETLSRIQSSHLRRICKYSASQLAGTVAIHEDFANGTRVAIFTLHTSRTAREERSSSLSHLSHLAFLVKERPCLQ